MREHNIVSHFNIASKRSRISDVMAIYVVSPSTQNFSILKEDIETAKYDNFSINFLDSIEEGQIKAFFSSIVDLENTSRIYKISVHPLNYSAVHDRVFDLNQQNPYKLLSSTKTEENQAFAYFDRVGTQLFSLLFNLRTIPLIKYKANDITKPIVNTIQTLFKAAFDKFPEIKDEFSYSPEAVLLILEREADIPVMLHHAASFGAMMADLFKLTNTQEKGKFPLDPEVDHIWQDFIATDFPTVHEKITEDLQNLQSKTKFLEQDNKEEMSEINEKLVNTLEGLRDLTLRQKTLETHTNFGKKLKESIESRGLHYIYDFEYNFLSKRKVNKEIESKFQVVLDKCDVRANEGKDLLRVLCIKALVDMTESEEDAIARVKNLGLEEDAVKYLLEKVRPLRKGEPQAREGVFSYLSVGKAVMMDTLSKYMVGDQPSLMAEVAIEGCGKKTKGYTVFDLLKEKEVEQKIDATDCIVFTYGGGSLGEFEYLDSKFASAGKNLLYGTDRLYSPEDFLEEIISLAKE